MKTAKFESRLKKDENLLPDWTAPENLRWAWWGWEPLMHRCRAGGHKIAYLGNSQWAKQWHDRIFSEATVRQMKKLGINFAVTHFFKGMGLESEKAEMLQTKQFVELCHKHGIKVAGYTQFGSLYYELFLKEQPNAAAWITRQRNGDFINYAGNVYYRWKPCVNSREFKNYLKQVITYGAEEIGLDAFHFDNADAKPCYCENCRGLFRDYLKKKINDERRLGFLDFNHIELPLYDENCARIDDPLYQEWICFRVESLTNAWRELYLHIKKINPDLGMITNPSFPRAFGWANDRSFHPRAAGKYTDMMWAENSNFPTVAGDKHISQIRAYKIGRACGYRVISTSWKHHDRNGDLRCPISGREVQLCLAEDAAFGGTIGTTWALRTTIGKKIVIDNQELADSFETYIKFLDRNRDLYTKAETDSKVAILHSFESFAYRTSESSALFTGMEQILISGSIPYEVIFEEDIIKVKQYRLLIVAGQECLSDKTIQAIQRFVRAGGKVFVIGESGACDEKGLTREINPLAAVEDGENVVSERNANSNIFVKDAVQHALKLSPGAMKVLRKIRKMLKAEDIPFSVLAPPGVFVNWTKLPDHRNVLHLINYDNEKAAVKVSLSFIPEICVGRKYSFLMPEKELMASGKLPVKLEINGLTTYGVVVIESEYYA
ncbi:MAG: beta-galactosidase [Victivallaceae bacterium]|nr:beta-galactosidase [Victivallaceae bacterium]